MIVECKHSIEKILKKEIEFWQDKLINGEDVEAYILSDAFEDLKQFQNLYLESERNKKIFSLLKEACK